MKGTHMPTPRLAMVALSRARRLRQIAAEHYESARDAYYRAPTPERDREAALALHVMLKAHNIFEVARENARALFQ